MTKQPRKPRIVRLDMNSPDKLPKTQAKPRTRKPMAEKDLSLVSAPLNEKFMVQDLEIPALPPRPKRFSWTNLFIGSAAALISLGIGLALDQLIRELFERQTWLGWLAMGLTVLLVLAALAILLREIWGISRLNTLVALRTRAAKIRAGEHPARGGDLVRDLVSIYSGRPDMAKARANFELHRANVLDGQDLLNLFETHYMGAIDRQAKTLVMQSAKRVSLVTAISPRALVDIVYVAMENIRLIHRISHLYGGRPGTLGFWKLTRNVLAHLAVTGAIAAGDSLIQQFIGHGLAARLSAKLGEGVVNGLLTVRIGITAMDQARPLHFVTLPRPGVSEFFGELTRSFSKSADK